MKLKEVKGVNDKQLALSTLETLPNDVSLHDIREEFEILESIKEGQQAAREGRTKTQEEVEQMAKDVREVLIADLDRSGLFRSIPREAFIQTDASVGA